MSLERLQFSGCKRYEGPDLTLAEAYKPEALTPLAIAHQGGSPKAVVFV